MTNRILPLAAALTGLLIFSGTAAAQQPTPPPETEATPATDPAAQTPPADTNWLKDRPITMQHFRPLDRRGINMFETPKEPGVEYKGFRITPAPERQPSGWNTAGLIAKTFEDGVKEHRFVRVDTHTSKDDAIAFSITKAQQIIDEQGDRLFRSS